MFRARRSALAGMLLSLALIRCSADQAPRRGQLMLALQTDMSLPKDVNNVLIQVKVNGATHFERAYPVERGIAEVPATLAVLAGDDPSQAVDLRVVALRDDEARTLSRTITTIPERRIALLRVPIEWLCEGEVRRDGEGFESTCEPEGDVERACQGGTCRDVHVDSATLPDYDPKEVFGGENTPEDGRCFPVDTCFDAGFAVPLALGACTADIATTAAAELNFAIVPANGDGTCSDDTGTCYVALDSSPLGWTELEAPRGGVRRFSFPGALCERLADGRAASVRATTACPTKTPRHPICSEVSSVAEPLDPIDPEDATGVGGAPSSGGAGGAVNGGTGNTQNGGAPNEGGSGGTDGGDAGASSAGEPSTGNAGGSSGGTTGGPLSCDGNPCVHGTCSLVEGTASCACFAGFGGPLCDEEEITIVDPPPDASFLEPVASTPNGSLVIANSSSGAYVWSPESGTTRLPGLGAGFGTKATAISEDGTTIVGSVESENSGRVPVLWRLRESAARASNASAVLAALEFDGPVELGLPSGWTGAEALCVSADGSVIFGRGGSTLDGEGLFRWTVATGIEELGFVDTIEGVSADGTWLAGLSMEGTFAWSEATGRIATDALTAEHVMRNGKVLGLEGGPSLNSSERRIVAWQPGTSEVEVITFLRREHSIVGANADGSVLLIEAQYDYEIWDFYLWDSANGLRLLRDVLTATDPVVSTWEQVVGTFVSGDGTLVAGIGDEPFIAPLPYEANTNECVTAPCAANAMCEERTTGFSCDCPPDRAGHRCGFQRVGTLAADSVDSGNYTYALSADGSTLAGTLYDGESNTIRWSESGGLENLGPPRRVVHAVNADGSVMTGEGFVWREDAGFSTTAELGLPADATVTDVSDDGLSFAGFSSPSGGTVAFRYTPGDGLETFPLDNSYARGMSADGSVVVGELAGDVTTTFVWIGDEVINVDGPEARPDAPTTPKGVSGDGSVVVGCFASEYYDQAQAFRWTELDGMLPLPFPGDGESQVSCALATNGDGSIVVGYAHTQLNPRPFVWDAENGSRYFEEALGSRAEGLWFENVMGISADGRVVAGEYVLPSGVEPYVIELQP